MARAPRLAALRRALRTRRASWGLAAALALLGLLLGAQRLGWHRLSRAASRAGHALADGARLVLNAGWLLLLLAAAVLALGLALSSAPGRAAVRWLRARLTTRPVLGWGAAAAGLLVVLFVLVVVVLPPRFTAHRHFDKASDELKSQNDVRTTLLQGLGALLVLTGAGIGAAVTLRQIRVSQGQLQADRYTKAVDQLGSEHLDLRLGGIYGLERIARDSPEDRATIEEILTAYVRGHAPWPPPPSRNRQSPNRQPPPRDSSPYHPRRLRWIRPARPVGEVPVLQVRAADVQAAVTVLGRRELSPDGLRPLDLTRVDLRRAQLGGANLQGAVLVDAHLEGANLQGANLRGAMLDDAHLEGATLFHAHLEGAVLVDAHLEGSVLFHAYLQGANLQDARLDRANLEGAWADERTRWPTDWNPAQARGVRYL